MKKMIIVKSLDVIVDDNTDEDDIKNNKYYNCSDDCHLISFRNVKLKKTVPLWKCPLIFFK